MGSCLLCRDVFLIEYRGFWGGLFFWKARPVFFEWFALRAISPAGVKRGGCLMDEMNSGAVVSGDSTLADGEDVSVERSEDFNPYDSEGPEEHESYDSESPEELIDYEVEKSADDSDYGETEEAKPSRAQARIRSLIEQNKALATELEAMRVEPDDGSLKRLGEDRGAGLPSEVAEHPAIKGAEFDEDGKVLYQGVPVTPEFAIRQFEMEKELGDLKGWIRQQMELGREAEHEARKQVVQEQLYEAVVSDIREKRAAAFPNLDERQADRVDRQILVLADDYVTRAINEGEEYSAELIDSATSMALRDLKETFGIFGARQLEDNQQYAEKNKIKPTGMPGVKPPKSVDKMTKAERETFADRAAKAAEAMRFQG